MLVNDDGDNVYHTLSKQKNAKKKNAVDHNQPGKKKINKVTIITHVFVIVFLNLYTPAICMFYV